MLSLLLTRTSRGPLGIAFKTVNLVCNMWQGKEIIQRTDHVFICDFIHRNALMPEVKGLLPGCLGTQKGVAPPSGGDLLACVPPHFFFFFNWQDVSKYASECLY